MKRFSVLGVFVFLAMVCFNIYIGLNAGQAQRQLPQPQLPTPCDPTNPACPRPTPNVTSVIFEVVNSPITDDPNFSGGKRIFPDKTSPGDTNNRKLVEVKAIIGGTATENSDIKVTFKAFDVDDPSSDTIIDSNGNSGNDNRPTASGGTFSTDPNQPGTSNEIAVGVPTGTSETFVYLSVTMQPGNNVVVAATSTAFMSDIMIDGTGLKDAQGASLPTTEFKRTELLTTWRKLHIEVDSMKAAQNNFVTGIIPNEIEIRRNQTETITVNTANSLELNRFQSGRLVVNNTSLPVTCFISSGETCNTNNSVTVKNTTNSSIFIAANSSFILYDDDDMNSDGVLDGDTGDDVSEPDMTLLTEGSDNPNTNVFAPAYIQIVRITPASGDIKDNSIFQANLAENNQEKVRELFVDYDLTNGNTNNEYWTAYILGAYQSILSRDNDPQTEPTVKGRVDAITGDTSDGSDGEGSGALIFLEIHRSKEVLGYNSFPERQMKTSVVHEIGHLFGCQHGELEVMGEEDGGALSSIFSPISINKIRSIAHP